jgi:hypothetical protein
MQIKKLKKNLSFWPTMASCNTLGELGPEVEDFEQSALVF